MLAVLLLLAALDPPPYAECSTATPGSSLDAGLLVEDHALGEFDGHRARARVCRLDAGFGYTQVFFVLSVERSDGAWSTTRVDHAMTACPEVRVRTKRSAVVLETSQCSYHDEGPTGTRRTTHRFVSAPPHFE